MAKVIARKPASPDHEVASVVGEATYRRQPCEQCPWRRDLPTGVFPAEAFRISAHTAYDAAMEQFACHVSGKDKMATCAGFLLANAANNLGVRLKKSCDRIDPSEISSPYPLYDSYRAMAVANGVDQDDPVLAPCRADWE